MPKLLPRPGPHVGWIGVDPGASGGMCFLGHDGAIHTTKMLDDRGVLDWLGQFVQPPYYNRVYGAIEQVGGYVPAWGNKQGGQGSAMFKFGMSYGALRMALMAMGIAYDTVTPQNWQKTFSLGAKKNCSSATEWKNKIKAVAQRLHPDHRMTPDFSDAVLIAHWCRRFGSYAATS